MGKKIPFPAQFFLGLTSLLCLASILIPGRGHCETYHQLSRNYYIQAQNLSRQKRYLDAAIVFDKAVQAEQQSSSPNLRALSLANNGAGFHFSLAGQHQKAISFFTKALELDKIRNDGPGQAAQLTNIAQEHEDLHHFKKAILFYKQALKLNKKFARPTTIANNLNNIGAIYQTTGKYKKALFYLTEALQVNTSHNNTEASISQLINISLISTSQGKFQQAIEFLTKALQRNEATGNKNREANILNNLGLQYQKAGNYSKSIKYLNDALDICERYNIVQGIPYVLNNLANTYQSQGNNNQALFLYQQSLAENKRSDNTPGIAINLNNIGQLYASQGQFDNALRTLQQALQLHTELGINPEIATDLSNIGQVYFSWGKHTQAIENYEKSLKIIKKSGDRITEVTLLNNLGNAYMISGHLNKSLLYARESLQLSQQMEKKDSAAESLRLISKVHILRGQYKDALLGLSKALDMYIESGLRPLEAETLLDIGMYHYILGDTALSITYNTQALDILEDLDRKPMTAQALTQLGLSYGSLGRYDKAIKHLHQSINILELIRKTAQGSTRRDYLASQLLSYQLLASACLRNGDAQATLSAIEQSHARLLLEQLSRLTEKQDIPSLQEIQKDLSEDEAILVYSNINQKKFILMVITDMDISMREISSKNILTTIQQNADSSLHLLLEKQRGQLIPLRPPGQDKLHPILKTNTSFQSIICLYRQALTDRDHKLSGQIGQTLYDALIDPVQQKISHKHSLIIIPDGILAFLPFETLITHNKQYLVQQYIIRYIQSLTIDTLLKKREYSGEDRQPLLALGGAEYNTENTPERGVTSWQEQEILYRETDRAMAANLPVGSAYARLGFGSWSNLPGTTEEVRQLTALVPGSEALFGSQVSEQRIKSYSQQGKLARYRVLHFATHGVVVPEIPALSALVLSQLPDNKTGEDGYLRMDEIARLNIKADFVNLSACETGLGKIYNGEGVVGLTQSFLVAGANGLSVSLWQVNDKSTAAFMTKMYEIVQDNTMGYAQALNEVKKHFIHGDYGHEWKDPYYWSPFVYYGE